MKTRMLVLAVMVLLMACRPEGLGLKLTFDRIDGLEKGAPVRLQGNSAGQVTDVTYTKEGHYQVDIQIKEAFVNACTRHTRFRIVPQDIGSRNMVVALEPGQPGGAPLAEGSVVRGDAMAPSVAMGITAELFKGLEDLGAQIEAFTREFANFEETQAYQRLKEELTSLSEAMVAAGREAREKIEKEVLPRIEAEIRSLRERMEKMGKEKEIESLEEEFERIKRAV